MINESIGSLELGVEFKNEDVRREAAALKKNIEQVSKEGAREMSSAMILDREGLIKEAERIGNLLDETNASLKLLAEIDQALLGVEDKKIISEMEKARDLLIEGLSDTNSEIDSISEDPKLMEALHDMANKINKRKDFWRLVGKIIDFPFDLFDIRV